MILFKITKMYFIENENLSELSENVYTLEIS